SHPDTSRVIAMSGRSTTISTLTPTATGAASLPASTTPKVFGTISVKSSTVNVNARVKIQSGASGNTPPKEAPATDEPAVLAIVLSISTAEIGMSISRLNARRMRPGVEFPSASTSECRTDRSTASEIEQTNDTTSAETTARTNTSIVGEDYQSLPLRPTPNRTETHPARKPRPARSRFSAALGRPNRGSRLVSVEPRGPGPPVIFARPRQQDAGPPSRER